MTLSISKNNGDVKFPSKNRNYCSFDEIKVMYYLSQKEKALPYIGSVLQTSNNESEIAESLYIINRMLDNGVSGIDGMYPVFSRFNDTKSPNIQTFLAGVYRKTKVPDAFGPLVKMLINNCTDPSPANTGFDPNEEIGGAILDYLA